MSVDALSHDSKRRFFQLFVDPVFERKAALVVISIALILLSLTQSLFILLLGPFFKVLFSIGSSATVAVKELLPPLLFDSFPQLQTLEFSRDDVSWMIPLGLLLTVVIKGVATYYFQYYQQSIALHVAKRYRDRLFESILGRSFKKLEERSTGEWMSLLMNDVLFLQTRYSDFAAIVVKNSVLILAALLAVFLIQWQMALLFLLVTPFLGFVLGRIGNRISVYAELWQSQLSDMAKRILSLRLRFPFIVSQGGRAYESREFRQINQQYLHSINRSIPLRASFAPGLEWIGFLIFTVILWSINRGHLGDDFGPGDLIQFLAAVGVLLRPMKAIGEQFSRFQETRGALSRGFKEFDEQPDKIAPVRQVEPATLDQKCSDLTLNLDQVSVSYETTLAVAGENLTIRPGKTIAIVGPSGSGKSSLLKALVGLLEPNVWQGKLDWKSWRRSVAFVSQSPFFFSDSLRRNLTYGLPEGAVAETDIWKALAAVGLEHTIRSIPDQLESQVHAIQSNFSGGQVQRLVIARAILRDQPVIALDEATSAIDEEAEKDITRFLIDLSRSEYKSILFVTHRLASLDKFDEIWFVNHAKIELVGSYQELLKNPRFQLFAKVQNS
ncbi:MAG: ABC transporter ATP-binding protein [Pseudobacteriovorax sp.]|nr:ABC transporter ATP-binding protein [Pseudobacteriovorax sp.]